MGYWIQTYTGKSFDVFAPKVEDVDIEDIAHALSNLCRFGGHCKFFYSVAQHSVIVSDLLEPRFRLEGLLHDAAEAYLIDVPRPIKSHPEFATYYRVEAGLAAAVAERYKIPAVMSPEVAKADDEVLLAEREQLFATPREWSISGRTAASITVSPMEPDMAKQQFLRRFHSLIGEAK